MTTITNTLQTIQVQELNDQELEKVNGGFLPFKVFALFHIAKTIVQCFRPRT
ncbi:MAG: class IIb bacteriocin, lactobin A/cerein 7B family [Cyanobacteriota bacterium]|nr:class IIb bacteriocin, lactobin A/cerein 7B family [Cyanobacteriota bacterium]